MRIYLKTTPNSENVPFDYQQKMIGVLHKWLGTNQLHDLMSLYSFSWLMNGKIIEKGFSFERGAKWFISFYDERYVKDIIKTILNDPEMFSGLTVTDIDIQETANLQEQNYFRLASPIFIKRKIENNIQFYTFEDAEANDLLVETIKHKMELANLPVDETLKLSFDLNYLNKKIKKVRIHNIDNKCNMCPVIIEGKNYTKDFIWNVGLGNSTGSGFGAIL
ncbi:MAG: CRISPR-associated endoribonuclease Cas6 [Bacteroides sp.]|jgi:CRISPR-associated endoribonuclease Cas6|nr:CRISPR-associated endoribonuclease Cas6 [Bacteroides sp.]MCI1682690.1 CRISPR-associated endoribonuclease Cas6 [Bacteroides sp.]